MRKVRITAAPYPWDNWFGKGRVTLTRGKHFKCQCHGLANLARHAAKRRHLHISVRIKENCVILIVRGREWGLG